MPATRTHDVLRVAGALALLAVGVDHIDQYYASSYSAIPKIGTLFVLNFISATLVAAGLLLPLRRVAGRWANAVEALLAASGVAIAAGALLGLLVSETTGLFGFVEQGYRPAIVLAIALEAATVLLLSAAVATTVAPERLPEPHRLP
jgi:hypothetical protein